MSDNQNDNQSDNSQERNRADNSSALSELVDKYAVQFLSRGTTFDMLTKPRYNTMTIVAQRTGGSDSIYSDDFDASKTYLFSESLLASLVSRGFITQASSNFPMPPSTAWVQINDALYKLVVMTWRGESLGVLVRFEHE